MASSFLIPRSAKCGAEHSEIPIPKRLPTSPCIPPDPGQATSPLRRARSAVPRSFLGLELGPQVIAVVLPPLPPSPCSSQSCTVPQCRRHGGDIADARGYGAVECWEVGEDSRSRRSGDVVGDREASFHLASFHGVSNDTTGERSYEPTQVGSWNNYVHSLRGSRDSPPGVSVSRSLSDLTS